MLTKKVQKPTNPPVIPHRPTLGSISREQIIETKDAEGNVISTEKRTINQVVPQPEHALVSDEPSFFYDVENLQAHGMDVPMNKPYYQPDIDDMSESKVSTFLKDE